MQITIPDDLGERLQQLAEQEGFTVTDLLKSLLNDYAPETPVSTLADLAQNALQANLASLYPVETATNSREILNREYADYLKRHSEKQSDADSD